MDKYFIKSILICLLTGSLNGDSTHLIGSSHMNFNDIVKNGSALNECFENAYNDGIKKAKNNFYNTLELCKEIDPSAFNYKIEQDPILDRSISQTQCTVKGILLITFADQKDKESLESVCQPKYENYPRALMLNDTWWTGLEIATGVKWVSTDLVTLYNNTLYIDYQYSNIMIYTLDMSFKVKLPWFKQFYIGAIANSAFSVERFTTSAVNTSNIRYDGTPSIFRYGYGGLVGYRLSWDFDLEAQYLKTVESVTRNYTDGAFKAEQTLDIYALKVGWYLIPKLKFWGKFDSEISWSTGLSWEYN